MSMELMVKAMKIRVGNPLRKLVLIKLADNASDQGECWPSYQHIADQCEISKRSVMNHIAALCESGLVKKVTRKGEKGNSSNIYLLHLDGAGDSLGGSANNSLSGAANSPGSAGVAPGGSAGDSPRTSHSFEPVKEPVNEPIAVGASADESVRVRSNRPEYSPEFEQAWLAYPKRAGGNLKSAAFKAWKARLNEGVNPETMLEGVKRYAGWVSAMGNSGTQFVKQAVTFFGPDRHFEESWEVPAGICSQTRGPVLQSQLRQRGLQPDPGRIQGVIMSLLNEVQKFIEAHPGCTSGDIADAFAGYSRQRVLQSASKLRQSGRVAHRCEGDTRRHFPRLTERAQEPEPQSVRETRPVRNFYVGTNDPRVILCLTRQAEELESRGLFRRAATVWMEAFRESHSQPERNNFLARRERCLRKSSKRAVSGDEWYLSGNYVGA